MTSLDSLNDATASPRSSALHMNKYTSLFSQISMVQYTSRILFNRDENNFLEGKDMNMREQILSIIEKNSRIDLRELAIILGTTEIDVLNEMEKMEQEGIICGYHTLINWEKTNIEKVTALIEVRVTPQRGHGFDAIAERIYKYPEVDTVYLISGGYDLLVILEGKSLKEVSNFVSDKLSTQESILSTATHFILKTYKDHGTIIGKEYTDERMKVTP